MEFKIGLGSLFSAVRQTVSVRYVLHWDNANGCWNVFRKVGMFEDYVTNFTELDDAQDYCDINNSVAEALDGKQ